MHSEPFGSDKANLIQVRAMCKAMSEQGMDVVLSLPAGDGQVRAELAGPASCHLAIREPLLLGVKIGKYLDFRGVRKAVRESGPDVIYLRNPLLLRQAAPAGIPLILELHDAVLHHGYPLLHAHWKRYLRKIAASEQLVKIVCISDALARHWISEGLPASKIITAHDAIDGGQFAEKPGTGTARKVLDLPEDGRIATYVGRLYEDRRIDVIFSLARAFEDTLFLVVGGPDTESRKLAETAVSQKIHNIRFTGQIPHDRVPAYLYTSDVLLGLWSSAVRTINYCSPLKVFEYMASGKTIVAQGYPTVLEVLVDGENAIIAAPDSQQDLIDKVGHALRSDDLEALGKRAREDVMASHTWKKRVSQIFEDVLGYR